VSWIIEQKYKIRVLLLALSVLAFIGPWAFESIYVPGADACGANYIRMDDDFCGVPLSGIRLIVWISGGLISIGAGFATGDTDFSERIRELLISLLLLFTGLPVFSTLLLNVRGDNHQRQVFTIAAWILGFCGGLYLAITNGPKVFWNAWGIWLYFGVAACALILEMIFLRSTISSDPKTPD